MKKILQFLLIISLIFVLLGCGDKPQEKEKPDEEPVNPPEEIKEKDKSIMITFYVDEDIICIEEYINKIELIDYSEEGYSFIGWYLDSELTNPFNPDDIDNYFNLGTMNLYAKMEKLMEDFDIRIALINNESAINPSFTWENNNNSTYHITLLKGTTVVKELDTDKTYYQVDSALDTNTTYSFKVLDKVSNKEKSIEFKTLSTYENKIKTITLDNPYSDNSVIQRNVQNEITGIGPEKQVISLHIGTEEYFALSDENGEFSITLPARNASFDSVDITITNNIGVSKVIKDVLFGDVYLFAGQSNMQWPTASSDYKNADIDNLSRVPLRFFCQDVTTSTKEERYTKNGRWFKPDANNVTQFSAIATITGSLLSTEMMNETPIGIVTAYQGDTNIANWMSKDYYTGSISTKHLHYNAMVNPLKDMNISGVVWYQGCNNSAAGIEYKDLLLKLFENYRDIFNNETLPFWVIGLACYDGDNGNNFDFSYVRESQAKACEEDNNAYFISTCDNGDPTYIHPTAKRYICLRVEKSICSVVYHKNYYAEGPSYESHTVQGSRVYVKLKNSDGLKSVGKITGFLIAGADGKYHEANAFIEDGRIVASSDKVDNPVYIKYGFGKSPFVSVFNKDDFAITPFRTDEYNTNIDLLDYDTTDNYTFHPDGSKMEISIVDDALRIKKTNDGKGYGSVRLNKWGAICYEPQGFSFTIKGTNSGASISFRAIEGDSYEIWAYKVVDDFDGVKTYSVDASDFIVVYNKQNNHFDTQKIGYVEVMIEYNGEVTFDILEARFVKVERTAPRSFYINGLVTSSDETVYFDASPALFADTYSFVVKDETGKVVFETKDTTNPYSTSISDLSIFTPGKPYYIYVTASNELGETEATNNGYVFYIQEDQKLIVCNFDFTDQESLNAYIDSSMSVHQGLTCTLEEKGVKIVSGGQGWQQFIFKLNPGDADEMSKLRFYADFTNYKGEIIMQLADTSYNTYNYTINLSEKKEGTYTINFNEFLKGSTPFSTQTLMWVMFNFNDTTGNGYILLDDVCLLK
ncbi:MAG: hypothetical protein J5666_06595 [Bacilli bacterium]|nr:hypothetical protein [Bacilli bacterium]